MTCRSLSLAFALTISLAGTAGAAAPPATPLYLELWQGSASEGGQVPTGPRMLLTVGQPTVAAPIAGWCAGLREQADRTVLPDALLRGAPYDRFATDSVPLLLEVLIDDVEMRYAMGTERPAGTSGIRFPFFELCPIGFGTREGELWQLDVLYVMNHRGDDLALGLYKGTLPATERAYLESQLGYSSELADPAGLLLLGRGHDIDTLLLVESADGTAFDDLRKRIVR